MPVPFIEAQQGIRAEKKSVMMRGITGAVNEAYHIGDMLIFRRANTRLGKSPWMEGCSRKNPKIQDALKKLSARG
jgi:hypothetical protein